jgi:hypothetical protein
MLPFLALAGGTAALGRAADKAITARAVEAEEIESAPVETLPAAPDPMKDLLQIDPSSSRSATRSSRWSTRSRAATCWSASRCSASRARWSWAS